MRPNRRGHRFGGIELEAAGVDTEVVDAAPLQLGEERLIPIRVFVVDDDGSQLGHGVLHSAVCPFAGCPFAGRPQ